MKVVIFIHLLLICLFAHANGSKNGQNSSVVASDALVNAKALKAESKLVLFKGQSNQLVYVENALNRAYKNIDVTLAFTDIPYARALQSANKGAIDGLFGVPEHHVAKYPKLIKIGMALRDSYDLVVINNNKCKGCQLSDISSLAVVNGYPLEGLIREYPSFQLINFTDHNTLMGFVNRDRSEAMLITDSLLPAKYIDNDNYTVIKLKPHKVYHYLNEKHIKLAQTLTESLSHTHKSHYVDLSITLPNQTEAVSVSEGVNK